MNSKIQQQIYKGIIFIDEFQEGIYCGAHSERSLFLDAPRIPPIAQRGPTSIPPL
jgi:hypothetical protein